MAELDLEKFTLGALLHDIGKLKQRAGLPEDQGKTHSIIGYEWLMEQYGEGIIAAAARDHHGVEKETWDSNLSMIIYEADNLAASERKVFDPEKDRNKSWQRNLRLASVFSRLSLAEGKGTYPSPRYWPLSPLGKWLEPAESAMEDTEGRYLAIWQEFANDFEWLKGNGYHLAVGPVLHLMEKYTSFVPSMILMIEGSNGDRSLAKQQDISLFDHLRVTAAAAGCLAYYLKETYPSRWDREILKNETVEGWEEDSSFFPFLLIGGDLSGVQRFLYTISSKGALKSLRGRSFYLELLTDYVVDRLLGAIGLARCNVIFQGGGHFYLLAPNLKKTEEHVVRVRGEVNDYLFDAFSGSLLQLIEWVPMKKFHFRDASDLWADLGARLNEAKKRKWADRLDRILDEPRMPHQDCLTRSCAVCGREDKELSEAEVPMCPTCREQFAFGEKMKRVAREEDRKSGIMAAIAVSRDQPNGVDGILPIGAGQNRLYYQPVALGRGADYVLSGVGAIYHLNEWDVKNIKYPGDRFFLAGVHHPKDLEDLQSYVENGFGWDKAAVLRMDVDRLGDIFREGFAKEDRTFSRLASLSRFLSLFFKYHLNGILGPPENGYEMPRTNLANRRIAGRGLSLVYSGGDDIFLVGRWLDVLEASFDIRRAFFRFTGNPALSISAGYAMEAPQHPIYRFAQDAGRAEGKAKDSGRDSLCTGRTSFRWDEAEGMVCIIEEELRPLLRTGESSLQIPEASFSKGFLHRLLALVQEYRQAKAWVLPKMAYVAGRSGPNAKWLSENRSAAEAWMRLKDRFFKIPEESDMKKLEEAILWILMMLRKGGKR